MRNTHRQQHKILNISTQQLDKGVHPSPGYISWSSFQWIIIIKLLKVLKKMPYNAQNDKPIARMVSQRPKTPVWLFRHLNRSKNEEVRPPGSLPLQLCCLWFYNSHTLLSKPGSRSHVSVKTQSRTQPRIGTNCRMVKGAPAPNRLGTWAYGAHDQRLGKKVV